MVRAIGSHLDWNPSLCIILAGSWDSSDRAAPCLMNEWEVFRVKAVQFESVCLCEWVGTCFFVCVCMHVLMGVWHFLLNLIRSQEAQVEIHVSEVGLSGMGGSTTNLYQSMWTYLLAGSTAKTCHVAPRLGIFWWVGDWDFGLSLGGGVRCGTNKTDLGDRKYNAGAWEPEGASQG